MRLQIAITAICSLKICQIALNESVKDRKIAFFIDNDAEEQHNP